MNNLNIKTRSLDKKSHDLRDNGIIPGTIYGPMITNTPIKTTRNELKKAIEQSGEVYKIMSKGGPIFVKFDEIQKDPITNDFLHFSLVQMPQGIENEVDIPVHLKGTPIGVKRGGTLVIMKDEVTVNGKPRAIPEEVEGNISGLDIGDKLTVDDLKIPKRVDAMDDESEVIAVCIAPVKEDPIHVNENSEDKSKTDSKNSLSFPAQAI